MNIRHPNPGAAIVRQWATDPSYFLKVISHLTHEDIAQMAQAAVAFHREHGSTITVDQQLAAWQVAAERIEP